MLESITNIGTFLGGVAVILSLVYIGYQLKQANAQLRADALGNSINIRLNIWNDQLDKAALRSAREKLFEHELYRRDVMFHELEELSFPERRALINALQIEVVYFQLLFIQRQKQVIDPSESLSVDYMSIFDNAPSRRHWKDSLRTSGHFPPDYIRHVDALVKKYDEVEKRMDEDQDADFQAATQEIFRTPSLPG